MKTVRLVLICMSISAVMALTGIGRRGFHWFPIFVTGSFFLIGIALLAEKALSKISAASEKFWRDKNSN